MANSKKSQWATWLGQTATLRASLSQLDKHEQPLYLFLRRVEKESLRVKADSEAG